jgi:hypothetical protein
LIAQTKARQLGLNIRKAADASALQLSLPNNIAAKGLANPGAYMPLAAARGSAASIFGGTSGISTYGIPRFMLPQDLHPSSIAYKLGASQEHLSQTLVQQQNLEANRMARQAGNVEIQKLALTAAQGMAEEGEMRSPSRVTKQKGAQLVQGAVQGIQEGVDDARKAGAQLGAAVTQGVSQSGRTNRRSGSEGNLIYVDGRGYVSEGQLARDTALANAPMYGPQMATKGEQFKAKFNKYGIASSISNMKNMPKEQLAGNIRNKSFGASGLLGLLSVILPGAMGEMAGMGSIATTVGGFMGGSIAKGTQSILSKTTFDGVLRVAGIFKKFIPVLGTVLTAYELFDTIVTPLIRKNADAYNAIADTLTVTQDKLDKVNNFFGTEIKLNGLRSQNAVVSSGNQTTGQATIAQQFRNSQEFKDTYGKTAETLKNLSNQEVRFALKSLAIDLTGTGMVKEQVQAIIDAIKLEAGKESIVINPKSFEINKDTSSAFMNGVRNALQEFQRNFNTENNNVNNPIFAYINAESIAKAGASVSEFSSLLNGLVGQYQIGKIPSYKDMMKHINIDEISQ